MQTTFSRIVQAATVILLLLVAAELRGIWAELRHIRTEQVKNQYYELDLEKAFDERNTPPEKRELLRRQFQSRGKVEIDGTVDVDVQNQPLEVSSTP